MKTMRLISLHGRLKPDQEMDDWGFNGPTIEGIVAVHFTYGEPHVFFARDEDANKAWEITDWEWFDDKALIARTFDDLLVMDNVEISEDGEVWVGRAYFGDWEVQTVNGIGEEV